MADLLATEAGMRGLHVEVRPHAPLLVQADARALRQRLFRAFLCAFDAAAPRSTVGVALCIDERHDLARVDFPATPEAALLVPCHDRADLGGSPADG